MCTSTHSRWVSLSLSRSLRIPPLLHIIPIHCIHMKLIHAHSCAYIFELLFPLSHHQSVALSRSPPPNCAASICRCLAPSRSHAAYAQLYFEFCDLVRLDRWMFDCLHLCLDETFNTKHTSKRNSQPRRRRRPATKAKHTSNRHRQQRHQRQRYRARLPRNCFACTCHRVSVSIYIYSRSHVVCVYNILFFFFCSCYKVNFCSEEFSSRNFTEPRKKTHTQKKK